MDVPEIAQAVVNPYEPEPGAVEIVAYYTRKQGAPDVSSSDVAEMLRRNLPGYMVPGYLEELPLIPMTPNNKADRKNLPAPKGPRLAVSTSKYVAPRTDTEKAVADALIEIMKIERASDRGSFLPRPRRTLAADGPVRSGNPQAAENIRRLHAGHLSEPHDRDARQAPRLASEGRGGFSKARHKARAVPRSVELFLLWMRRAAARLVSHLRRRRTVDSRCRGFAGAMRRCPISALHICASSPSAWVSSCLSSVTPIAMKWLLIGRWKPETIPIWSLRYFRFWLVKTAIRGAPIARLGGPIYNVYLRLLGAKIGSQHGHQVAARCRSAPTSSRSAPTRSCERIRSSLATRRNRTTFTSGRSMSATTRSSARRASSTSTRRWRTTPSSAIPHRCTAASAFRAASIFTARRRSRQRPTTARSSQRTARSCGGSPIHSPFSRSGSCFCRYRPSSSMCCSRTIWEFSGAAAFVHDAPQDHLFAVGVYVRADLARLLYRCRRRGIALHRRCSEAFQPAAQDGPDVRPLRRPLFRPAGDRGDDELRVLQSAVRRQLRRCPLGALARL